MAQLKEMPRGANSGRVIARFGVRMAVVLAFAAFGGIGFEKSLIALLWMSTILSAIFAAIRREFPLADILNHWDEATAYLAVFCLVTSIDRTAAI